MLISAPLAANSANLLYRQGFETPVENHPEIQWKTHGYELTQAIVNHEPKEGDKSVRGNFNPKITDPITKMKGVPFVQLKINFKQIAALKNWYHTTDQVYVSWWFKHDKCHWKGPSFNNADPLATTGKFAFIRMNEDPATSYYFTMNGGQNGNGVLAANNWHDFWQKLYNIPSLYLSNQRPWGADGLWHKLSFFIGKHNNEQKYLMWWIDDHLMQADKYEKDGKNKIYNGFTMDSIQFWHSFSGNTDDSIPVNGGSCNGWQIDDFQVWDGIPNKPKPPFVQ